MLPKVCEWTVIAFTKNHWILSIHSNKFYSNFTNKNVSWLHFSWATQSLKGFLFPVWAKLLIKHVYAYSLFWVLPTPHSRGPRWVRRSPPVWDRGAARADLLKQTFRHVCRLWSPLIRRCRDPLENWIFRIPISRSLKFVESDTVHVHVTAVVTVTGARGCSAHGLVLDPLLCSETYLLNTGQNPGERPPSVANYHCNYGLWLPIKLSDP